MVFTTTTTTTTTTYYYYNYCNNYYYYNYYYYNYYNYYNYYEKGWAGRGRGGDPAPDPGGRRIYVRLASLEKSWHVSGICPRFFSDQ